MRCAIIALMLFAGVAHAELNAIGKARGLDPHRVDKDTNDKTSKLANDIYTNTVLWQTFSYDDTPNYYDLSTSTTDGSQGTGSREPSWSSDGGGSFDFDGTDDFIDLGNPAALQFTGAFSLTAWIKTGDNDGRIIAKDDVSSNRAYFMRTSGAAPTGKVQFYLWRSGAAKNIQSTAAVNDSAWHHVAGVNDGTDLKIYVDGILSGTSAGNGGAVDNDPANVYIGAREYPTSFAAFDGLIDDADAHSTGLTSNQVFELFTATAGDH